MRRLVAATLAAVMLVLPAYAASGADEITPQDVAAALEKRRSAQAALLEATAEYDAAVNELAALEERLDTVATEIAIGDRTIIELRAQAEAVARTLYMDAGSGGVAHFLDADSINELPVREKYLEQLSQSGAVVLSRYEALTSAQVGQRNELDTLSAEQAVAVADLEVIAADILTRLETADADYRAVAAAYEAQEAEKRRLEEERRRREEEARLRQATSTTAAAGETTTTAAGGEGGATTTTTTTAAPPPPSGGQACPVNGAVAFTDTWGAPRSGGRTHKGVDMIAARGTPLVAIESGTISKMGNGGLGGITLWLKGVSGDSFYYAHLDGFASGLHVGQSVAVGELVGYNGNTGNARYTVPHLHFEWHPGGSSAVNPYPLVAGLCF